MAEQKSKVGFLRSPLTWLAGLLVLQLSLYFPTYQSMVDIWWRSETFAHGFFIVPISAYLIWKKRQLLAATPGRPDVWSFLPLLGVCLLWLVAKTVDVLVVEQFAAVLMLPLLVWLVQGFKFTAVIAFPLAFLLFAVPFGEFLVYPLMEFTAVFTVNAVRMMGIPVFWEGMYFSLPSGSWSVVEACSGFRYILASLTLGALFAYLTYHSFWRRAAFMLLALLVPIAANGLRAFMIVMIGHFSGMELAVGVDHLIYGWVWFGIVMFVMFWIGSFWQQKSPVSETPQASPLTGQAVNAKRVGVVAFCAALVLLAPILLLQKINSSELNPEKTIHLPAIVGDWQQQEHALSTWQPEYRGASQIITATYRQQDQVAGVHIAFFANQQQGAELVNSSHRLIAGGPNGIRWKDISRQSRHITLASTDIGLKEIQMKSSRQSLLVWNWKYFNGTHTDNDFYLKALEGWAKLTGQPRHGAAISLYVELDDFTQDSKAQAVDELIAVANQLIPELERALQ